MKIYASDSGFIGKNILIVGLLVDSDHVTITNLPFNEPFAATEARGTKTPCWRVFLSRSQSFICSSARFCYIMSLLAAIARGLVKRDLVNMYIIYICLVQWFLKFVDE